MHRYRITARCAYIQGGVAVVHDSPGAEVVLDESIVAQIPGCVEPIRDGHFNSGDSLDGVFVPPQLRPGYVPEPPPTETAQGISSYASTLRDGILTPNEIRGDEGLPPEPDAPVPSETPDPTPPEPSGEESPAEEPAEVSPEPAEVEQPKPRKRPRRSRGGDDDEEESQQS